jgi:hypothetical protein
MPVSLGLQIFLYELLLQLPGGPLVMAELHAELALSLCRSSPVNMISQQPLLGLGVVSAYRWLLNPKSPCKLQSA